MATYRFLAYAITNSGGTDTLLGEVPFDQITYEHKLNKVGTFRGTVVLGDPKVGFDPIAATTPRANAIYVERDGVLVWGGPIVTRRYKHLTKELEVTASTFWWFMNKRIIGQTVQYVNQDPLFIARDLVTKAMAVTGGNFGLVVGSEVSGQTVNQDIFYHEGRSYAQSVESLAGAGTAANGSPLGFDFDVRIAYDGSGNPSKTFTLGWPFIGRSALATNLIVDLGSDVTDYEWFDDATNQADQFTALGAGQGTSTHRQVAANLTQVNNGAPLVEGVASFRNINDDTALNAVAQQRVLVLAALPQIPTVKVRGSSQFQIGAFVLGDAIRLFQQPNPTTNTGDVLQFDRFPSGLDSYWRIVDWQVDLSQGGRFEILTLTLNPSL